MFTGIVEEIGTLRSLRLGEKSAVLEVDARAVLEECAVGDSILTDGVCLTVTALRGAGFTRGRDAGDGAPHHAGRQAARRQRSTWSAP